MNNSGETRLLVKRNDGKCGMCYLTALSPRDLSEIPEDRLDLPFLDPRDQSVSYSCSGGLLSMSDYAGHIYLCNPTTKQFQTLPPKDTPNYETPGLLNRIIGSCVGYDSKSDDYRILRIWERDHSCGWGRPVERHRTYELYSLRNDSWKEIPTEYNRLRGLITEIIYARGKFYWRTLDFTVMSYDCSEESFSFLPSPPNTRGLSFQLVKFNDEDSLGVVFSRCQEADREAGSGAKLGIYFELWIWRGGSRCWDRVFNVSLDGCVGGVEGTIYGQFLFVLGLVGPPKDVKRRLVAYDWGKKECKELGIRNYMSIDVFCYVESTVALPHGKPIYGSHILDYGYFDKDYRDHDRKDKEAPFDDYNIRFEANLKDFEDNGFRIIDDIELEVEEEEVGTNGNMPFVYYSPNYGYGQSPFYPYNPYIPNYGYGQSPFYPYNPYIPNYGYGQSPFYPCNPYIPNYGYGQSPFYPCNPYIPNYGYGQSSFYPYNPYIPGAMIGANRSIIATQHNHALPLYENPVTWASYPPLIFQTRPDVVANGIVHSFIDTGGSHNKADGDNVALNTPSSSLTATGDASGAKILSGAQGNIITPRDECNRVDFPVEYANAKFFVIKSHSEDDVHKSIKYSLWSSTPNGNKKLNDAYDDAKRMAAGDSRGCSIFLFFSVNASGQFCGIAEMSGPVDFHRDMDFWLRDKRSGSFPVKWHIIKDLSNSNFRHIILEKNENTPVTNSIDIQEISFKKGLEMLEIFKGHTSKSSLLENRQRNLQGEREAQASLGGCLIELISSLKHLIKLFRSS